MLLDGAASWVPGGVSLYRVSPEGEIDQLKELSDPQPLSKAGLTWFTNISWSSHTDGENGGPRAPDPPSRPGKVLMKVQREGYDLMGFVLQPGGAARRSWRWCRGFQLLQAVLPPPGGAVPGGSGFKTVSSSTQSRPTSHLHRGPEVIWGRGHLPECRPSHPRPFSPCPDRARPHHSPVP